MKTYAALILVCVGAAGAVAALGACTPRPQGLFADTSPAVVSSSASKGGAPRFIGRWTTTVGHCDASMVIKAKALNDGLVQCDFVKVDTATAGYSISAVCTAGKGPEPVRLTLTLPDPAHANAMTLAGGPFHQPVALERCS
jgi:hypothetical protein